MNHINQYATLTDQLERKLIQQEINRQRTTAPAFNFKRIADRIASLFGYVRIEGTLNTTRTAY